jgi:hypothetical protein
VAEPTAADSERAWQLAFDAIVQSSTLVTAAAIAQALADERARAAAIARAFECRPYVLRVPGEGRCSCGRCDLIARIAAAIERGETPC